jgi:NMD protein affecting ribosome stability and mRNA decay
MSTHRVSLVNYDLLRELCDNCRKERFHFVPMGDEPMTGTCKNCGADSKLAEVSDTSIWRLMTKANGEVVVVPLVAN